MMKMLKIGDLVTWYSENEQDIGIVTKHKFYQAEYYIVWSSNVGNGWFSHGHPSIGVIN